MCKKLPLKGFNFVDPKYCDEDMIKELLMT